jgi:AmmeMemoRadiSam system protein B
MGNFYCRPPAVAGTFYPADPDTLSTELDEMLAKPQLPPMVRLKALIVPHAGYVYSGISASKAYCLLPSIQSRIERVVLLGPAHRMAIQGLVLPTARRFATPLGEVDIDINAYQTLQHFGCVSFNDVVHALEHSLEIQLPFLQATLGEFSIVPLAVGYVAVEEVVAVLEQLWGGDETLIVISSDLSHFHDYQAAQSFDYATVQHILDLQPQINHQQACGAIPINALIEMAQRRGLTPHLLDLRNSGDVSGDLSRVVGYAALAFEAPAAEGAKRVQSGVLG